MYHLSQKEKEKNKEEKNGQSGGASRSRVCYQWGLPCLVFIRLVKQFCSKGKAFAQYAL